MTRRPDGDDEHPSDEDAKAARHSWIAEQLGAEWRSDGGGVYRFVGPASQPLEHEPADAPGVAEDPTDAPTWFSHLLATAHGCTIAPQSDRSFQVRLVSQ